MNSSRLRKIAILYPLLLIVCGLGYAKYSSYMLDGDAVAFMDIADAMRAHNSSMVINGYWNPMYAVTLALGQSIAHPSRWNELQTYWWVNFWIFVACIFATIYFVRGLILVRNHLSATEEAQPALSPDALLLVSLALLFFSFQRELILGAVRADSLLLFFFLIAAAFLLRLQATGRFVYYPLLGCMLGLAYLTKSFAFFPSCLLFMGIFFYGLIRKTPARKQILTGAIVAGILFAAVAGPYIAAISKQRGRFTIGESSRLNYAFFIDGTERWNEWHSGKLGLATANFKHHEQLIADPPPVYSFDLHPLGTYPLWFDPSYWTDGLQPHFALKNHILRLLRCLVLLVRFLFGHLEPIVFLAVLLLSGGFFARSRRSWLPFLPASLWGLVMLGIYLPIAIEDRYLTPAYLLFILPVLAMVRRRNTGHTTEIASGLAVLLAFLAVANAVSDLGLRRRTLSTTGYPRGAYSKEIYPAAQGLNDLGILPGQTVACFGDGTCHTDIYWARLAGTPIRAEIEAPEGSDVNRFWQANAAHQEEVLAALRAHRIAAIVAYFEPSGYVPQGWHQLGTSDLYAYLLNQ
jgi:4-amino-4-deoxy-L-arabinose transferase-like glycosyltransferase